MSRIFRIQSGQADLVGESNGSGEALVFLHAGVADRRMWRPQMEAFQNSHQVVAYDRRGFGETTSPDEPFSNTQDLESVLNHFDLTKVTLVGCSQGGRIAIDFALTFPDRVNKLVLIAPAISGAVPPEEIPADIEALLEELEKAEEADDLEWVNKIEAHLWLDGPQSKAGRVSGPLRGLFLDMNGIALAMPELEKETEPASAYERVSQLTMPTLVLWGDLDFPHIQDRCRYLVESIPAAQGQEIKGTAHLPNLERPDIVNNYLSHFLE
ncbi:MAG: alpha/beta fold hydrolase [Anaerolineae bacterium]